MKKLIVLLIVLAAGAFAYLNWRNEPAETAVPSGQTTGTFNPDPSSATFHIENEPVTLSTGKFESDEQLVTLLGEKASGDLNGDGKADTALLLSSSGGASGVFIYAAAYVSGPVSYKGTNAIFIGDRVSPESVSISNGVVTLTYLDRKADEPFSAEPTVLVTKQFVFKNGEFVAK